MLASTLFALPSTVMLVSAAPTTSTKQGMICVTVTATDDTSYTGRIVSHPTNGLYTLLQEQFGDDGAMRVSLTVDPATGPFTIHNEHGERSMPYLAFIAGPGDANNGNLQGGMFSYVYLGGSSVMTSTPAVNLNTVPGAVDKYFGITGDLQEYQKFGNESYPATSLW
ncbi:hypothetical protein FRB95_013475 [Tulasnella sp. JGI-2019a]|nr:hypothetical protein FRB95_013475 [Tulasnella sp. JGI-2019a]